MTTINNSPPLKGSVVVLSVTGWLVLSLFTATQWQLINATYGLHKPWLEYFRPALIANLIWAGAMPVAVYLAKHIQLNVRRAYVFFAVHLLTGSVVAVAHTLIYVLCLGLLLGGDENLGLGSQLLVRKLASSFQANLLIYATIVAFVVGRTALTAARQRETEKADLEANLRAHLEQQTTLTNGNTPAERAATLAARVRGRTTLIPVSDVDWIGAAGDYVELHVGGDSFLVDDTITKLARDLRGSNFIQIHRSTLISTDRIKAWQPSGHGDAVVVMKTGQQLRVSRKFAGEVRSHLSALSNI